MKKLILFGIVFLISLISVFAFFENTPQMPVIYSLPSYSSSSNGSTLWNTSGTSTELITPTDIDFQQYMAVNMVAHNDATAPASGTLGQWFLHRSAGRRLLTINNGVGFFQPIMSLRTLTYYVDGALGSDGLEYGYGTGANAFATINYALSMVAPINAENVVINVAEGTYLESVAIQGKQFTGAYSLTINGASLTQNLSATADSWTKGAASTAYPTPDILRDSGAFGTNNFTGYFWTKDDVTFYPIIWNNASHLWIADNTITSVTTYKIYNPPTTVLANSGNNVPLTIGAGQLNVYINRIKITNSGTGSSFVHNEGSSTEWTNCWVNAGNTNQGTSIIRAKSNFYRSYLQQLNSNRWGVFASGGSLFTPTSSYFYGRGSTILRFNTKSAISGQSFYSGNGANIGITLLDGGITIFNQWFKDFGTAISADAPSGVTFQNPAYATFDTCTTSISHPKEVYNSQYQLYTTPKTQVLGIGYDATYNYTYINFGSSTTNWNIVIGNTGNIGINKASPTHVLHVNGTIRNDESVIPDSVTPVSPLPFPSTIYGNTGYVLAQPNKWWIVNLNGTDYSIPVYGYEEG